MHRVGNVGHTTLSISRIVALHKPTPTKITKIGIIPSELRIPFISNFSCTNKNKVN